MAYCLLTGATGFLGQYLLRDCLLCGMDVAVLVRPTKRDSTRQRLEAVMAHWEKQMGRSMPRPVVLCGDCRQENLGLADHELQWLSEHCTSVLHNGASMTFHADTPQGEPFHSNVVGTRMLLD